MKFKSLLGGANFQKFYHIFCRVVCMVTLAVQAGIVDFYLVDHQTAFWSLWFIADLAVLGVYLAAFVVSYRYLRIRHKPVRQTRFQHFFGDLPLAFVAWLLHSAILSAKICALNQPPVSVVHQLNEADFFGPNMLKTGISLSSIVIYLLVLTHHDYKTNSKQNEFIQGLVGCIYLDVLDTTQFLGILKEEDNIVTKFHLHYTVLAIISINFILPSEVLLILSRTHFGVFPLTGRYQLLHKVVYFMLVNVPMFMVRMVVWHLHDQNVSVFLVKNIIAIGMSVKEIHEFWIEVSDVILPDSDDTSTKYSNTSTGDHVDLKLINSSLDNDGRSKT